MPEDPQEELELDPELDQPQENNVLKEIFSWSRTILFAVAFALLFNRFIIVNATVPSGSMEGTIRTNDRIIAFRLSYLFSEPGRFDIVVFPSPDQPDTLNVKRIIGLPGERVNIIDGRVYINDADIPLRDDFVQGPIMGNFGPYYIPEGHLFMLGDYRSNSTDSRRWTNTYVYQGDLLGRVVLRYFPGIRSLRNTWVTTDSPVISFCNPTLDVHKHSVSRCKKKFWSFSVVTWQTSPSLSNISSGGGKVIYYER